MRRTAINDICSSMFLFVLFCFYFFLFYSFFCCFRSDKVVIFYKDGIYYDILQAETVAAVMRYADYAPSLQEHNNINFQCVIEVDENGQIININKVYRLKLPDLKITVSIA